MLMSFKVSVLDCRINRAIPLKKTINIVPVQKS